MDGDRKRRLHRQVHRQQHQPDPFERRVGVACDKGQQLAAVADRDDDHRAEHDAEAEGEGQGPGLACGVDPCAVEGQIEVGAKREAEELERAEHYAGSQEYKAYAEGIANHPDLWCKWSEKYINWRQLEILGLMSKGNWA